MWIWYFANNLDIYDYVEKFPEQHFSVWLFSNPGDKSLFLLKFNVARIRSEWSVSTFTWTKDPRTWTPLLKLYAGDCLGYFVHYVLVL